MYGASSAATSSSVSVSSSAAAASVRWLAFVAPRLLEREVPRAEQDQDAARQLGDGSGWRVEVAVAASVALAPALVNTSVRFSVSRRTLNRQ